MTLHFHFFPRQTKNKPWKQRLRERTNRHCAGNHPRSTKADVSPRTLDRHVLEDTSGMDTDGHELVCSKSIHQRSQSTGCVLVRKAPTKPAQVKADCDGASSEYRERYAMSSPLGQAVTTSWGPVTVAIPLPWTVIADDRVYPLWW